MAQDTENLGALVNEALDIAHQRLQAGDLSTGLIVLLSNIAVALVHVNEKLDKLNQPRVIEPVDTEADV